MPVKGLQLLCFVAALAAVSATVSAEEAKPGLLGATDLKSIVLSPAPLGPPAQFEPPPSAAAKVETFDAKAEAPTAKPEGHATREPTRAAEKAERPAARKLTSKPSRQKAAVAARKPKASPLESYARDARRQTWPCVGGGICSWTQPRQ